jgi:hypothetical protein
MKEMADFSVIRSRFESDNVPYFIFYPKFQKVIRTVTRHLPVSALAEDISLWLVNLDFDVLSFKQMSTIH